MTGLEHEIAVPFRIRTTGGVLSFFSMTTVFGTPVDVVLSELALELFSADDDVAAVQRLVADAGIGEFERVPIDLARSHIATRPEEEIVAFGTEALPCLLRQGQGLPSVFELSGLGNRLG